MRKNELIELLQNIKGNPEICTWNGYVGDWMSIDKEIVQLDLVKETPEFLRSAIDTEHRRDNIPLMTDVEFNAWMKEMPRKWEMPNQFVDEEDFVRWYGTKRKKILVLNPKPRGKSSFDRLGDIDY